MSKFEQLLEQVKALEVDFIKFYEKGQSAAGTRLRKGLSDLKKTAQDLRNNIQEVKQAKKTE